MSFTIITGCSKNQHLDEVILSRGKVIGLVIDSALVIIFTLGAMALCGMLVAGVGGIGSFAVPVAFCLLALAVLIVVADTITLMVLMTKRYRLQQKLGGVGDDHPSPPSNRGKLGKHQISEENKQEIEALRQRLQDAKEATKNNREQINQLETPSPVPNDAIERLKQKHRDNMQSIADESERLQKSLQDLKIQEQALLQRIKTLEDRKKGQSNPDNQTKRITEELKQEELRLIEAIKQCQQQIGQLKETLTSQLPQLTRPPLETFELRQQQARETQQATRKLIDGLELERTRIENEIQTIEKKHVEATREYNQLEKARNETKSSLDGLKKGAPKSAEVLKKEQALKEIENEIAQLEHKCTTVKKQIEKEAEELKRIQAEERDLEMKVERAIAEEEEAAEEVRRGNEEIQKLKVSKLVTPSVGLVDSIFLDWEGEDEEEEVSDQTRKIGSLFSSKTPLEETVIGNMKKEYLERRDTLLLEPSSRRTFVKPQRGGAEGVAPKIKTAKGKLERHTRLALEEGKSESTGLPEQEKFKAEVKIDLKAEVDRTKVGCLKGNAIVGIAHDIGYRREDEDAFGSQPLKIMLKGNPISAEIHLVCDGHTDHGYKAKFVAEVLPGQIETILSKCEELNEEVITNAITESIALIDAYLCAHRRGGGTTLTGMLYINDEAYFFNVGDSRSVLCTIEGGKVTTQQMTRDADPFNPKMARKVTERGGKIEWLVPNPKYRLGGMEPAAIQAETRTVSENGVEKVLVKVSGGWEELKDGVNATYRVNTNLNMTGDIGMSSYSCQPTIGHVSLKADNAPVGTDQSKRKRYALIACDGLWDNLTSERAGELIAEMDAAGKTPEQMSWYLSQANLKLQRGEGGVQGTIDNLTIMVVALP